MGYTIAASVKSYFYFWWSKLHKARLDRDTSWLLYFYFHFLHNKFDSEHQKIAGMLSKKQKKLHKEHYATYNKLQQTTLDSDIVQTSSGDTFH